MKSSHLFKPLRLALFAILFIGLTAPLQAQQNGRTRYDSVEDALMSGSRLRGSSGPQNVNWINNGERYSYKTYNREKGTAEIRAYDPDSGEDQLIFDGQGLTFPDTDSSFTYNEFQWSHDSRYLLFESNFRPVYRYSGISDYYYYSIKNKTLRKVAEDAYTAELSPDGKLVGYERKGDLYTFNLDTGKEKRLTSDAKEHVYNGRFGWVYEEEFSQVQAWAWSHDSKYIAYWQTDESQVPIFRMTDYSGTHKEWKEIPYPQVGDPNPKVKIGVVDVENGDQHWMNVDVGDGYVPRIYWTSKPGVLAVVTMNRAQNHLEVYFYDVTTGKGRKVMEETSKDGWIDVYDFFAGVQNYFYFPKDLDQFFWISDRDGYNHLYRFDYDGKLLNQVTEGDWEVTKVHAVDADQKVVYYSSTEADPTERQLYTIKFDGSDKKQLTQTPGRHEIDMAPNGHYYIDRYSNVDLPLQVDLRSTNGELDKKLEDNQAVKDFVDSHVYANRELFSFTTTDGQKLDGYIIKPVDFDSTKTYPLFLNIYGGPGAQSVYNEFEDSGWMQYLAQEGYVIASVNNRGSGGYGRDFEEVVYKQLGKYESKDFVETAQYLAGKSWIDGDRMAIRGHSYGGFMTSFTTSTHPGVFKVGLIGAPVTDWRLYDSIYAERYMGLLENNKDGYIQSSSSTHAAQNESELFIAHATSDENVHVQNTFQFVTALTKAGIDADLRIYPPGAHGVAFNRTSYILLYTTYTDFLNRHMNMDGPK